MIQGVFYIFDYVFEFWITRPIFNFFPFWKKKCEAFEMCNCIGEIIQKPKEKKVAKNECPRHAKFYNILQYFATLASILQWEKIRFIKLNLLQSNRITFQNAFRITKILKIDAVHQFLW